MPYREFAQLMRRLDMLEQRQIGETLVRLEERQHGQGQQLASLQQQMATVDANVKQLQQAETQRSGVLLSRRQLGYLIVTAISLLGVIIGGIAAIAGLH